MSEFVTVPGTGTAALGAPVIVESATPPDVPFALSADFDGNGKRDLVLLSVAGVHGYPGNGDFTFGSRQLMKIITPGKGVAVQYRPTPRAASLQAADHPGVVPTWVRLSLGRSSGTFTSSWSKDGEHWVTLASVVVPFAASSFYIGLPVASHDAAVSTSAVFDDVTVW